MQLDRPHGQMSDSFLMSAFIILSGGLQDAYTYCCRDKVFANAQTGNIVLMSTHLFAGDWAGVFRYFVPLISFMAGIFVAECDTGLQNVLQTFHRVCPDAYIYLLTVNICGEEIRWSLKDEITECNSIMREYCSRYDWAEIVETEYAFYDDADYTKKPSAEYFVSDYLHFSSKGYSRLKTIVRGALQLD